MAAYPHGKVARLGSLGQMAINLPRSIRPARHRTDQNRGRHPFAKEHEAGINPFHIDLGQGLMDKSNLLKTGLQLEKANILFQVDANMIIFTLLNSQLYRELSCV